jgi:glycosyltransferase involved in cell wall biosynthesis/MoaA/NifB/PqqE/SkfB family radical SAM enzyme
MYRHQPGKLSKSGILDVGLKCAHSCKFCYYSYLDESENQFQGMRKAQFRTLEECKRILDGLKANGLMTFDVTGGEPTLHPHIIELMEYAHKNLGMYGRIITLGQFLMRKMAHCQHEKLIDDLLNAGVTNFLFSLHAVHETLFHEITGESFEKLHNAMLYLDSLGFQYTTNTTVFSWNYTHLPQISKQILKHKIYVHNFIIMNAYYEWNKDGRAFGVQAKYSDIYPHLKEAVYILESNGIAVNIRYAPLCSVKGLEKNLVGMVGVRYDPHEWMNIGGHQGGSPEFCSSPVLIEEGGIEKHLNYQELSINHPNGTTVIGGRGNLKHFSQSCSDCSAKSICDGIDPNYLALYGDNEFIQYDQDFGSSPLQTPRLDYHPAHIVKTSQFEDVKSTVSQLFKNQPLELLHSENISYSPKISVVIPTFNNDYSLRETVQSVIIQSEQDFEIIIVNDGSTDLTQQVAESLIREYPNYQIKLINQSNSGQPAIARNTGISNALGYYVLPLDADDTIHPDMLSETLQALENNPLVSIAYTNRYDFGEITGICIAGDYDYDRLKYQNHISYCALYKKQVWEEVGGYRTNVIGCEDWDFWIAAGMLGHQAIKIDKALFRYRTNNTGIYQTVLKKFDEKFSQIILNNSKVYSESEIFAASNFLEAITDVIYSNLKDINWLILVDWNQAESDLLSKLTNVLSLIVATNSSFNQWFLDTSQLPSDIDIDLLLSSCAFNLIENNPNILESCSLDELNLVLITSQPMRNSLITHISGYLNI